MATQYDPKVIQEFADRLYTQAKSIVLGWTIRMALIGFPAGFIGGAMLARSMNSNETGSVGLIVAVGLSVVFGSWGYVIGKEKSFLIRLQAQQALCQVEVEQNTRNAAEYARQASVRSGAQHAA